MKLPLIFVVSGAHEVGTCGFLGELKPYEGVRVVIEFASSLNASNVLLR